MITKAYRCCITVRGKNLSTLNCVLSRRRKKSPNLFWGAPQNSGRATFNQVIRGAPHSSNLIWGAPQQSARQHVQHPPPLHSLRPLPPSIVCTADYLLSPTPSHPGKQRPTHPSTPLVHSGLGCGLWPRYRHLETTQAGRLQSRSKASLQQFLNFPGCGENLSQSSACFSVAR
jgi:hypothetical protein